MRRPFVYISPAAAVLFSILYFFDTEGVFAMLLPAVLAHETGHALAINLGGGRIKALRLGIAGFEMRHDLTLEGLRGIAAVGAGPLFGLLYGALCAFLPFEFFKLSGGFSIALSLFNMLPVLPLDGGRLLCIAMGERGEKLSRGISFALLMLGGSLWLLKGWISVFAMSIWLFWYNNINKTEDIS